MKPCSDPVGHVVESGTGHFLEDSHVMTKASLILLHRQLMTVQSFRCFHNNKTVYQQSSLLVLFISIIVGAYILQLANERPSYLSAAKTYPLKYERED